MQKTWKMIETLAHGYSSENAPMNTNMTGFKWFSKIFRSFKAFSQRYNDISNIILPCAVVSGTVRERMGNGRQYIIESCDGPLHVQSHTCIFGAFTKRHPLAIGDRILAIVDPVQLMYLPGWIIGTNQGNIVVKFCDGQTWVLYTALIWSAENFALQSCRMVFVLL